MTATGSLHLDGRAEAADLDAFLGRATRMDPAALVRLRSDPATRVITAYLRLPFDVLVGRSMRGTITGGTDVTVRASALADRALADRATADAARTERADATHRPTQTDHAAPTCPADPATAAPGGPPGHQPHLVRLPERCDTLWRGQLPPAGGWRRMESVPVGELRRVVAAGVEAFQTLQTLQGTQGPHRHPGGVPGASPVSRDAAEALLDQDALTVSDSHGTAVLPLRVCHAAWRMGFLGPDDGAVCAVSVAGRWARIAAPFGTAYRDPIQTALRLR